MIHNEKHELSKPQFVTVKMTFSMHLQIWSKELEFRSQVERESIVRRMIHILSLTSL